MQHPLTTDGIGPLKLEATKEVAMSGERSYLSQTP